MGNIITDKDRIDEVLHRGVEIIYPNRAALEALLRSGTRIRLYCGFDPSASSLHIGNAILLNKLGQFQSLGHEVIFLVGDFTGMIGDPTDKKATRRKLSRDEVRANAKGYQEQAAAYIRFDGDNPARILYNSEWSDRLSFKDLIELTSNFTVQQMIARDMFQERLKEERPIHLHEFLYPLAQAYDSVAMEVDLEIGGSDQLFNMMCGRDLMKAVKGREKYVLTAKLLTDASGKKMGKSEGNMVNLNEDPNNMFGQVMAWSDGLIANAFELATAVPMSEVAEIRKQLEEGAVNPRDLKLRLAAELVTINHGSEAANTAREHFEKTIQKKEVPDEMPALLIKAGTISLVDALVEAGLAPSKGEARRLIEQKGVRVNGRVVEEVSENIELNTEGVVVQKGKFHFIRLIKA